MGGMRDGHVREAAWRCLMRWAAGGAFAETLVAKISKERSLGTADRALLQAMVYGTLRHLSWLDHVRKTLRTQPLDEPVRWLVLVGLCQLLVMEQSAYAAVNETVAAAPRRVRGVVNAMLRRASANREALIKERVSLPLDVRYSMPSWLVERWVNEFGAVETEAMLAWNLKTPPLYARINPLNPPALIPGDWSEMPGIPGWYRAESLPLALLEEGRVYMADLSTRYSVSLLAPRAGERVLDACAAPGGKSVAMIGVSGGKIHLLATDSEQHRLEPLRENLLRSGGRDVQVLLHDWTRPCPPEWMGAFDAVLLDVPCSNSGVLQRRVDARWRLRPDTFSRMAKLQLHMLERSSAAVKPGGRLVYSTCSIDGEEDRSVVQSFLDKRSDFRLVESHLALPHREQADGAYAALLYRASNA